MRSKKSFILTVINADTEPPSVCGQIKNITTGQIYNFQNIGDLNQWIAQQMTPSKICEETAPYQIKTEGKNSPK